MYAGPYNDVDQSQTEVTILPDPGCRDFGDVRTSAARAAADFGSSPVAPGPDPTVRPPVGVGVYEGFFEAGVGALFGCEEEALPKVRPVDVKLSDFSLPKQLPMSDGLRENIFKPVTSTAPKNMGGLYSAGVVELWESAERDARVDIITSAQHSHCHCQCQMRGPIGWGSCLA